MTGNRSQGNIAILLLEEENDDDDDRDASEDDTDTCTDCHIQAPKKAATGRP